MTERDPILTSITKSLNRPIISGHAINSVSESLDDISRHSSTSSIRSSASTVSNISNISNSSMYTIRQERRLDLSTYWKDVSRIYLSEAKYHLGLTSIIAILGTMIGTTVLYGWSLIISAFLLIMLVAMVSIHLVFIIRMIRANRSDGILRFWDSCMILAYKNALLLQEYVDVYEYGSKIMQKKKGEVSSEEKYITDADENFQLLHPSEIKKIIQRIHSYIRLAYELSNLRPTDNLLLQRNTIYCNVSDQSLTNERNRKIENLLNRLDSQKKTDIIGAWNMIDKKLSTQNKSMSFIPFRWATYEYRNLFRYLNSSPDIRKIYNNIGLNFESYELCVIQISQSMHSMRAEESMYPEDIREFTIRLGDMLGISADVFYGLSIITNITNTTSIWSLIMGGLSTISIGFVMHLITIVTILEIQNLLLRNRTEHLSESKIDHIFKEIEAICC